VPINVGGDDSVRWEVDVRNARYKDVVSRPNPVPPAGVGPYQNIGVDDTGEEPYSYTVVVKIPKGGPGTFRTAKADFAASLSAAAQQARAAVKDRRITSVSFQLPVEDIAHGGANHDQLHIDWDERPRPQAIPRPRTATGRSGAATTRGRGGVRKRGR
jgi:hypothetical protein